MDHGYHFQDFKGSELVLHVNYDNMKIEIPQVVEKGHKYKNNQDNVDIVSKIRRSLNSILMLI